MKQLIQPIVLCFIVCVFSLPLKAQILPRIKEQPWIGFFSAYEQRGFHFGIHSDGQMHLYLMKSRKERAAATKTIIIYPELCVEDSRGKRSYKRLKEKDGLSTEMKAGLEDEKVTYTAETTGNARIQIDIRYDGNEIMLDGKVLESGEFKEENISVSFKVMMPAFYNSTTYGKDKKKAKDKMKRDKFRFIRADNGEKESLKVYEKYDLSSKGLGKGVITELEVDMGAQEGKTFIFKTVDGKGEFYLENRYKGNKAEPWTGYYVKWKRPAKEEAGKAIKPLVIQVK